MSLTDLIPETVPPAADAWFDDHGGGPYPLSRVAGWVRSCPEAAWIYHLHRGKTYAEYEAALNVSAPETAG